MEYVVFLVGLVLFAVYARFSMVAASVLAFVLTGALMPRVEFIDALGKQWWLPGAYGVVALILLYTGFAGVFERLNSERS